MSTQQATRIIDETSARVREILLDAARLPDWNSAFLSIEDPGGTAADREFAIVVRPGLRGTWRYTVIEDERIDTAWKVPGFAETGTWQLRPHSTGRTLVTHGFEHRGPLARVLANAYRGVAEVRLDRLAQRAAAMGPAPLPRVEDDPGQL
ncbi:SRPBCC family protein [Micromonospora coerulea]|uniref:SRPBCC family protein n=1 Tax=Micromonospora coerulea TaxID=47856 RepID=UPI001907BCA5|nr:SRPBCC family protein [Micromonospora veneta]